MELQEHLDASDLVVERAPGQHCTLLNLRTHERRALPDVDGCEWFVDAQDGVAFLYADNTDVEPLVASDMLRYKLFRNGAGHFHVFDQEQQKLLMSLDAWLSVHEVVSMQIVCGVPPAPLTIDAGRFTKLRDGGAYTWSLSHVFYSLHLGGGRASTSMAGRWCASSWGAWERRAGFLDLCGGLLKSAVYSGSNRKGTDLDDEGRVLPWPTMTTTLMAAMLCIWAFLPRFEGGFKDDDGRHACEALVVSLVNVACHQPWAMHIFVDGQSVRKWPADREGG